ncbi:YycH family regulatory protein [Halalkalibacter alkaliphilus]|uniref:Two-component system activity regulator YycH n=1 Tax=Halalkalibacter alkaliphilus TaxID=2917993 RepID=A0A9X2CSN5_9BACI|nr:two-component system activity regulator YycH [Halalkalibacter alkaliphilus]MCL7747496.1 two-component system activity regulator YycH [Halalkalibacter alkaliphilus]
MNYEHIKSTILIGLIGISIILTWQLYTFQPEIALLDDTVSRYVPDSMNEEREERMISEVILPEQIIVHRDEEYAMIPKDANEFEQLYNKLFTANFYEVNMLSTDNFPTRETNSGVEFIFPDGIPIAVFQNVFGLNEEEVVFPAIEVDRLFLFVEENDKIHMQILSSEEERLVEFETSLLAREFEEAYVGKFDEFIKVSTVLDESEYADRLNEKVYVPSEPVIAERLSFATSALSAEFYKQSLFTDPGSVKFYQQTDGEDSYTDGNRIITMQNNGLFMEYFNPVFVETQERSTKHIVQSSYEFINGHGGWTNDYFLSSWNTSDIRDEVTYRMHVNGLPVVTFEGQGDMALHISRSGTQIVNYTRPLFELDSFPIDAREQIQLPSGEEVLDQLKKQEFFDERRLTKVTVGYEMVTRSTSFVTIEPHWFIYYGNRWQKVTFDKEEGDANGLE